MDVACDPARAVVGENGERLLGGTRRPAPGNKIAVAGSAQASGAIVARWRISPDAASITRSSRPSPRPTSRAVPQGKIEVSQKPVPVEKCTSGRRRIEPSAILRKQVTTAIEPDWQRTTSVLPSASAARATTGSLFSATVTNWSRSARNETTRPLAKPRNSSPVSAAWHTAVTIPFVCVPVKCESRSAADARARAVRPRPPRQIRRRS